MTTYVFINIENPNRIKMVEALNMRHARICLEARLLHEINSGLASDYDFGYHM